MTPAPLTNVDCDLRDFAFMPLDVVRLRDSDLAALTSGDEFRCAVLLWCASWHQVPAASLPDDDIMLAQLAGFGRVVKAWKKVRTASLRGWLLCTDGRLYHPVVAEKAREAWRAKLKQRWLTECSRVKKHCQRHKIEPAIEVPDFEQWLSLGCPHGQPLHVPGDNGGCPGNVPGENNSNRQGQGQGQGQGQLNSVPTGTGAEPPAVKTKPEKSPEEMAKAELWRAAVSVLEQGGCPPSQCRTFMGKLVQDYTFEIVQKAVAAAVTAQPAEAREFLKATCQRLAGERKTPGKGMPAANHGAHNAVEPA